MEKEWTAWLAGIIEGEGWLGNKKQLSIYVCMTDEDVVRRVLEVAGCGTVAGPVKRKNLNYKPMWRWTVHYREDVARILKDIRPYLGVRRGTKADELLAMIEKMKPRARTHGEIRHGTVAGYEMELLRKLPHCRPCKDACAARQRGYRELRRLAA